MKTERRHDLETNWLASHMAEWIKRVKSYSAVIWVVVIGVVVIGIGGLVVANQSTARNTEAWTEYYSAVNGGGINFDELEKVSDNHAGTAVEEWADIVRADMQLRQASILMFADRASAEQLLADARRTYRLLQRDASEPPIQSRASFGLGRVFELEGQLDKAKAEYAKVDGVFAPLAKARAERISEGEVEAFYDWFATAQPAKVAPPQGPGTPGDRPLFEPGSLDDLGGELPGDLGLDIGAGLDEDTTGGRYSEPRATELDADAASDPISDLFEGDSTDADAETAPPLESEPSDSESADAGPSETGPSDDSDGSQ